MLKELRLTDIVLIESAHISFAEGFNVLSGESGAGKSAIMNALNLVAGERSDVTIIRRGADKGVVEAIFDIDHNPALVQLLESSGIDHEAGSELFIRRELSVSGKSRAFLNNQLAQLSLLKQVSAQLFDIIGQHANQKLLSLDYHRNALDSFGKLEDETNMFSYSWKKEMAARDTLEQLISSEAQRMREIEICRMELEELRDAAIQEGEEEEVFAEYTQLSNADELLQKADTLTHLLSGERTGVLTQLTRHKSVFEQLIRLAPSLKDTATLYENTLVELHEISHSLRNFQSHIENNPERAVTLSERLDLITRLKRKYGPTVSDINAYIQKTEEKLNTLENADIRIDQLKVEVSVLAEQTNQLGTHLTTHRKEIATTLEKAIVAQLRSLNMPKVEFFVEVSPQKRNSTGDDRIEFFLIPNVGEHRVSLRECASGGELSRTMLSLQAVLAGKEQMPTLVFDEIDANIGGETAALVGGKMKDISQNHQVLCITHFPQVAKQANHHLRISKQEINGRTVTLVDCLNDSQHREQELIRMHGG